MVRDDDDRLASRQVVARADLAGVPALLQELLHHAQRHPEPIGNLFTGALPAVVRSQYPFAQVQRWRFHPSTMKQTGNSGSSII